MRKLNVFLKYTPAEPVMIGTLAQLPQAKKNENFS
jgi:hypothetical protein